MHAKINRSQKVARILTAGSLLVSASAWAVGTPANGTLYYTTYAGGNNLHKVDYNFDGTTFSLTGNGDLGPGVPGADGIVFTGDGQLAIGGQAPWVNKASTATGALIVSQPTSVTGGGPPAFHMMVSPDGTIWASSIPGTPIQFSSTLSGPGTPHVLTGDNTTIDTISWAGSDPTKAFYTSSGSAGYGDFGTIDLTTFTTHRLATLVPAAHGMSYDPYSGNLILFGNSHITQVAPNTAVYTQIADFVYGGDYDQGTTDGKGHIFAANNSGYMTFLDITTTMNIGTADFVDTKFLASFLDDVAPLVGPGSHNAPESLNLGFVTFWLGGLCLFGYRKAKTPLAS